MSIHHSSRSSPATTHFKQPEPSSSRATARIDDAPMDDQGRSKKAKKQPEQTPDEQEDTFSPPSDGPEEATICEFVLRFDEGGGSKGGGRKKAIAQFVRPLQDDGWVVLDFRLSSPRKVHIYTLSRDPTSARFRPEEDEFLRVAKKLPSVCLGRGEEAGDAREEFRVDSIREETKRGKTVVDALQVDFWHENRMKLTFFPNPADSSSTTLSCDSCLRLRAPIKLQRQTLVLVLLPLYETRNPPVPSWGFSALPPPLHQRGRLPKVRFLSRPWCLPSHSACSRSTSTRKSEPRLLTLSQSVYLPYSRNGPLADSGTV
jgi:hypothetical protein